MASLLLMDAGLAQTALSPAYKPTRRGGGGPLRVLFWQGPTLLNPHFATGTKDSEGSNIFYEGLARWDADGVLPPEEVCRRYRAEGYDFLALTDHFVGRWGYPIVDTVPFRAEGFTTILGAELHSGAMANGELWHILAVGLPPDFAPSNSPDLVPRADQETAAEIAARAVAAGAFVAIAHPQWSGLTLADARAMAHRAARSPSATSTACTAATRPCWPC